MCIELLQHTDQLLNREEPDSIVELQPLRSDLSSIGQGEQRVVVLLHQVTQLLDRGVVEATNTHCAGDLGDSDSNVVQLFSLLAIGFVESLRCQPAHLPVELQWARDREKGLEFARIIHLFPGLLLRRGDEEDFPLDLVPDLPDSGSVIDFITFGVGRAKDCVEGSCGSCFIFCIGAGWGYLLQLCFGNIEIEFQILIRHIVAKGHPWHLLPSLPKSVKEVVPGNRLEAARLGLDFL